MPVIKAGVSNSTNFFNLNGKDYTKNLWEITYSNIINDASGNLLEDVVEVGLKEKENDSAIQRPAKVSEWKNGLGVPYSSLTVLLDDLQSLVSLNSLVASGTVTQTSVINSSTTPLAAGATFTGVWELNNSPDVMVSCKTDSDCNLLFDFSPDGVNADSTFPVEGFDVTANINEFHTAVKGARYFRVRIVNGSTPQTYLRLSTNYGTYRQGNLPVSAVISQDADAIVVRNISEQVTLAENKFAGYSIVSKLGKNADIDTGSTPEDLWDGGGVYTGFPVSTVENLQVLSSSASDTGILFFLYLADSTSESYQLGSVTLAGTTPVDTGIAAWRVHTGWYDSGDDTTFNVGNITLRHITTTANIFLFIPIGRSQSNACVYTIPANHTGYITNINLQVRQGGGSGSACEGSLWVRTTGASPRLRQPFAAGQGNGLDRDIIRFPLPAGTDVTMRIIEVSTINTDVVGGFQVRVVRN